MQVFIKSEEKPKRKNKCREIDPSETADFLNRPVKKTQDLNKSLRKSYEKGFFKDSRFEHFKILKQKRKARDKDSVASEDYQDEDYHLEDRKNLRSDDRYTPKISKVQAKANKQQSKKRQNNTSNSSLSSSEQIPTSKRNKKMAKRPAKFARPPTSSSSSSSSSSQQSQSHRSSSEHQQPLEGQVRSVSQQSTAQKQPNQVEADQNMDSVTKEEAFCKNNHFQQNNEHDQQDSKHPQFDKKSSSAYEKRKPVLSPASLHHAGPFLLKQDESSTKQKSQSNQIQHLISVASQTESNDPSPKQTSYRNSQSRQNVEFNYKTHCEFLSNICQHIHCCPFLLSAQPNENADQQEESRNEENEPTTGEKSQNQRNETNTQIERSKLNNPSERAHSGDGHLKLLKK